MKEYKTNIYSLNILRVILILLLIVISCVGKYALYIIKVRFPALFQPFNGSTVETITTILLLGFSLTAAVYILIFLPLSFSRTVYSVDDKGVSVKKGIIINSLQYMRIESIQYVSEVTTPFSQLTGFNFLVFNGQGNRIMFTFISQNDAREITENVKKILESRTFHEDGVE